MALRLEQPAAIIVREVAGGLRLPWRLQSPVCANHRYPQVRALLLLPRRC
jgi:hypothetical protein